MRGTAPRRLAVTITKIEAARRQLRTALELWFADGDEVSIHTLACAAHQIIHDLNRLNKGPPLMFDNPGIGDDEKRKLVVSWLTFSMSFFKHADKRRAPGAAKSVELDPNQTQLFLFMAVRGLTLLGEKPTALERAFDTWLAFQSPEGLPPSLQQVMHGYTVVQREKVRAMNKQEFLQTFRTAFALTG